MTAKNPNNMGLYQTDDLDLQFEEPAAFDQARQDEPGVVLEPIHSQSYDLSYNCLLIPRFPAHKIKGDLSDLLPQWLQQVCVSYGWRLEFVTVHPDYMQWSVAMNASVTAAHLVHTVRTETSKLILSNFGRIAREVLSDDFWAPGHIVVLGSTPHPREMISQYIHLIRRRQGFDSL